MICLSVAEPTVEACLLAVLGAEWAEIRLDALRDAGPEEAAVIFAAHPRLIATFRSMAGEGDKERKRAMLIAAVEAGAAGVDVEIEWTRPARDEVIRAARAAGSRVIVSYHNHDLTPGRAELEAIVERCFEAGASTAKIACRVNGPRDNARLLGLLDDERSLIVVGMGRGGRVTRLAAPFCGGFLTFASAGAGKETAEGQLDAAALKGLMGEIDRV